MKTTGWRRIAVSAVLIAGGTVLPEVASTDASGEAVRSWPKDTTEYVRDLIPGDSLPQRAQRASQAQGEPRFPSVLIVDTVVENTDPDLTNTDTANDGETSIAVNPENPDEMLISSFSTNWYHGNAVVYHSTDGGGTWTQQGVPRPPGWVSIFCPCDWTWDWGRGGALSGSILAYPTIFSGLDITSVTTADAADPSAFSYNGNPAQRTNVNVPSSFGRADQPWVLTNLNPLARAEDNVYVAWDDFNYGDARVAVSAGVSPLDFTLDRKVGNFSGDVNPGLRLADDRVSGTMWALWARGCCSGDPNMDYMLNRSTDGGSSWTLNGNTAGIIVANAWSTQPTPKFGTVNALLGGVHHAAVDPTSGDLYYVYGNRDDATGNDRLAIRRISDTGGGNVAVGPESFVTGQVEAALPQVAVLDNGTVGIFYYTFDGMVSGFPQFTAHLTTSEDQLATFTDTTLLTFLSSATGNSDPRQRVLGDYMQMKALENCFYGSFTANGAPFGRPISNHDPIFFKTCVDGGVEVAVDIKPGSAVNPIHPSSRGVIPVAILGAETFDVADVDASTLAFGLDGATLAQGGRPQLVDVNGDGFPDLLAHFRTQEAGIAFGDTEACVSGALLDGTPFEGCDSVSTEPPGCGRGFELALAMPALIWLRKRRLHVGNVAVPR